MGKVEEIEKEKVEDIPEEKEEYRKSEEELRIERIIAEEGEIPQFFIRKNNGGKKITIIFEGEEASFDAKKLHSLLLRDYKFFKKYRKYRENHRFFLCQEPFSYMYEKKCWEYRFFDKLCILLKRKIKQINTGPFTASGFCPFFEFETLYSPSKCSVYQSRSREIMRNSLEKFRRAALSFNADYYEFSGRKEIIDDSPMVPLNSPLSIRNKKVKILRKKMNNKDEIPSVDIDRSLWPSNYLKPTDKPRIKRDR